MNGKIVFVPNGRLGNAIFRYMACALLNINNPSMSYILNANFDEPCEKFTFYLGLDNIGDDLTDKKNDKLSMGYNTLGYYKHTIDHAKLTSNVYINKANGHGIYIKNTLIINDDNFFHFFGKNLECFNVRMESYFQFGHIYLRYKPQLLAYMEAHKHEHVIQTNMNDKFYMKELLECVYSDKIYDIVIHIRLDDFTDRPDFIDSESYLALFETMEFKGKTVCLLCDHIRNEMERIYLKKCIGWFKEREIAIKTETNALLVDFHIMKQAKILVCSMSTLAWTAAYLSQRLELCYMPEYNFYDIADRRTSFFKKPIENTLFYAVKTTSPILSCIKSYILTLPEYTVRLNKLDNFCQKLACIGIEPVVYHGVNGKDITIGNAQLTYQSTTYGYDATIRLNGMPMTKGEFGCAWSHLALLKQLSASNTNYYLILEDDVELVKSLDELSVLLHHIPSDADMCHLAKSDCYPFQMMKPVNAYFNECEKRFFNKTTAYLISQKGARKVLAYAANNINVPIDDLYNMVYRLTPDFRFYVPGEFFFQEQANISSSIQDINLL